MKLLETTYDPISAMLTATWILMAAVSVASAFFAVLYFDYLRRRRRVARWEKHGRGSDSPKSRG